MLPALRIQAAAIIFQNDGRVAMNVAHGRAQVMRNRVAEIVQLFPRLAQFRGPLFQQPFEFF